MKRANKTSILPRHFRESLIDVIAIYFNQISYVNIVTKPQVI